LYDPKTSAVAKAYAQESTQGVGTLRADLVAAEVDRLNQTGAKISEDDYNNNPELYSEGQSWYDGMTMEAAKVSKEFNDGVRRRQQIIADSSTGQSVLGFAAGFGAGMFEPKNLAVGAAVSVAAPILGNVGWLGNGVRNAYRLKKTASLAQKVKIGVGEGIVAAGIIEPSNRSAADRLQQDYTMMDSLFNVATSAAFGAFIPVAGKGLSSAKLLADEKIAKFRGRAADVVAHEVDLATQQLDMGQRVDVKAVEAMEIGKIADKPIARQADVAEKFIRYTETPEFKARFEGSKGVDVGGKPKMLFHGTNKNFDSFATGVGDAIFFSDSPDTANSYATSPEYSSTPNIRPAYLNTKNPLEIDANGSDWHSIDFMGEVMDADSIAVYAKSKGYDGLVRKNVVDDMNAKGRYGNTTYAVFSPDQIIPAFGEKSLADIVAQTDTSNAATIAQIANAIPSSSNLITHHRYASVGFPVLILLIISKVIASRGIFIGLL